MKLITLNIWGGHVRKPLLDFISTYRDIDIFCFQEVYHNAQHTIWQDDNEASLSIFSDIDQLLPKHTGFFRPVVGEGYGIGIFIKKEIDVLGDGEILIHENPTYAGHGPTHSRILQWVSCRHNHKTYSIVNVHCLWNEHGKTDSPARIDQSQKISDFMDTLSTPKILCGDFNLRPDTESIKILERKMTNLISVYNVKSTRTRFYEKDEPFADYLFTSPDITTNTFSVMNDEVSDHAPLLIDFD